MNGFKHFNRLGSEGKLKPTVPYHDLFSRKELKGFPLHTLPMWTVNFPTGHITCCDPLVTLPSKPDTYIRTVEPGTYLLETKIIEMEPNQYRYVASRVIFNGNEPVNYELALKGTEDIEILGFNTAISQLMVFVNDCYKAEYIPRKYALGFIQLLAPFAPHLAEEMWEIYGNTESISYASWPTFDESKLVSDTVEIVVQLMGKVKAKLDVKKDLNTS